MTDNKLLTGTELLSIIIVAFIFFKVLFLSPKCFNIGDSYFTILPLFMTKIIEFKLVVMKK